MYQTPSADVVVFVVLQGAAAGELASASIAGHGALVLQIILVHVVLAVPLGALLGL